MADYSPKKIRKLSLSISLVLHLLLLIIPACSQKIIIEDRPNTYSVPVELSMVKPKPKPKPVPKIKKTTKKKTNKKGIAQKKKEEAPPKPAPSQPQPGDRDTPLAQTSSEPTAPKIAINNEWEGTIVVLATISPEGKLIDYKVTQSTGHIELDDTFVRALKSTYIFKPRQIFGKKQTGQVTISYTFEL
jgi:periplasmic protein TonB